jgi:actin-like ATPase involved in cell morphogenesis
MATGNNRATEELRRQIEAEREGLATAVDTLRSEISEVTNVSEKLKAKLPAAAAGAVATGFVLAGGIGATMRLFARKSREGTERARFGRFRIVDRD